MIAQIPPVVTPFHSIPPDSQQLAFLVVFFPHVPLSFYNHRREPTRTNWIHVDSDGVTVPNRDYKE